MEEDRTANSTNFSNIQYNIDKLNKGRKAAEATARTVAAMEVRLAALEKSLKATTPMVCNYTDVSLIGRLSSRTK